MKMIAMIIGGLFMGGFIVYMLFTLAPKADEADEQSKKLFENVANDVYDSNKKIVQKVNVNVGNEADGTAGKQVIVDSTNDGNKSQKIEKVITAKDPKTGKAVNYVIVNVSANNNDAKQNKNRDKFDEDWDESMDEFNEKWNSF